MRLILNLCVLMLGMVTPRYSGADVSTWSATPVANDALGSFKHSTSKDLVYTVNGGEVFYVQNGVMYVHLGARFPLGPSGDSSQQKYGTITKVTVLPETAK